jgi:hypothetical protein
MAKIKTKDALREYIKRRLGAPLLKVELTEDMLDDCIDKAIEVYSEYAYDGCTQETLLVELIPGQLDYVLPDSVIAVTGLQSSSTYSTFINIPAGYTLAMNPITLNMQDNVSNIDIQSMTQRMAKMSNLRSIFDVQVNFDFNFNTKILRFFEQPVSSVAVLELGLEYEPMEVDNIYGNQWIKKRAEGEAWAMWGSVMGKYSSQLVNGSEINYADMQSKGEAIIEKSEEELEGLFEPLGVWVF